MGAGFEDETGHGQRRKAPAQGSGSGAQASLFEELAVGSDHAELRVLVAQVQAHRELTLAVGGGSILHSQPPFGLGESASWVGDPTVPRGGWPSHPICSEPTFRGLIWSADCQVPVLRPLGRGLGSQANFKDAVVSTPDRGSDARSGVLTT